MRKLVELIIYQRVDESVKTTICPRMYSLTGWIIKFESWGAWHTHGIPHLSTVIPINSIRNITLETFIIHYFAFWQMVAYWF